MQKFFYNNSKPCNVIIIIPTVLLSGIGILTLCSISRYSQTFPSREVLIQSAALLSGILISVVIIRQGCRYFIQLQKILYISSILFLLSVYLPGIGTSFFGSRSWLDLGFITIQPSEFVKITFVIIMASYLSNTHVNLSTTEGIIKSVLFASPFILIVSKEDFGSGCVYCAIWFFMVFCSGLRLKIIVKTAMAFLVSTPIIYWTLAGYQKDRINAFLYPKDLSLPGNYQVWNAKSAIGSGGLVGKGFMNGTQASLGFLPVPESDFIFAATVEEWGFIGGFIIIALFGMIIFYGFKSAKYACDLHGTLVCAGITGMFFFQAFENIAMNMGIMPVTGITLPLMSYGGSSMVTSITGVGLILSCRQKQ